MELGVRYGGGGGLWFDLPYSCSYILLVFTQWANLKCPAARDYLTIAGDVVYSSCSLLSSRGPNSQRQEQSTKMKTELAGVWCPGAPPPASAIVSEVYLRG
eukprot:scaffold11151_cov194-Skeletonema_dohrnii-CCMP3373.AAC.3